MPRESYELRIINSSETFQVDASIPSDIVKCLMNPDHIRQANIIKPNQIADIRRLIIKNMNRCRTKHQNIEALDKFLCLAQQNNRSISCLNTALFTRKTAVSTSARDEIDQMIGRSLPAFQLHAVK